MAFLEKKLHSLLEANRILSSTLDYRELMRRIMQHATEVVDAETASLLLYDAPSDQLHFDVALGDAEVALSNVRINSGEGIAGWVAREKKSLIVNDVSSDHRWTKKADDTSHFHTRSILAVPLVYQNRLLGVIEAINKKNGIFSDDDVQLLEAFAAQAAVAIENATLFKRLAEEKDKIEAMFTHMSDGAIFVDEHGHKILANTSAQALLGSENLYKPTIAEIFSEYNVVPAFEDIVTGDESSTSVELSRTAGKTVYIDGVMNRVIDNNQKTRGFVFVFRDVTTEKKEELVKRDFLSLMSHKLKTPLVAITGYGPILLADDTLNDRQRKAVSSIHRQGLHLASLVDKLLYFTMTESGTLSLVLADMSMHQLIEEAIGSMKSYIQDRNAHVILDESLATLPKVRMDREKMEAVIKNVVENAVKFCADKACQVEISGVEHEHTISVIIADNGQGIPPEERNTIFNKFYQIEESFTGQVEGAGLGLALVKQVVEAHGGTVDVESVIGQGAKFIVTLPR